MNVLRLKLFYKHLHHTNITTHLFFCNVGRFHMFDPSPLLFKRLRKFEANHRRWGWVVKQLVRLSWILLHSKTENRITHHLKVQFSSFQCHSLVCYRFARVGTREEVVGITTGGELAWGVTGDVLESIENRGHLWSQFLSESCDIQSWTLNKVWEGPRESKMSIDFLRGSTEMHDQFGGSFLVIRKLINSIVVKHKHIATLQILHISFTLSRWYLIL
jgi:hypothetical protein